MKGLKLKKVSMFQCYCPVCPPKIDIFASFFACPTTDAPFYSGDSGLENLNILKLDEMLIWLENGRLTRDNHNFSPKMECLGINWDSSCKFSALRSWNCCATQSWTGISSWTFATAIQWPQQTLVGCSLGDLIVRNMQNMPNNRHNMQEKNMQKVCNIMHYYIWCIYKKNAKNIQEICKKYARNMQEICKIFKLMCTIGKNMQEICKKRCEKSARKNSQYAKNVQKKYAKSTQNICTMYTQYAKKYAINMEEKYARNM